MIIDAIIINKDGTRNVLVWAIGTQHAESNHFVRPLAEDLLSLESFIRSDSAVDAGTPPRRT